MANSSLTVRNITRTSIDDRIHISCSSCSRRARRRNPGKRRRSAVAESRETVAICFLRTQEREREREREEERREAPIAIAIPIMRVREIISRTGSQRARTRASRVHRHAVPRSSFDSFGCLRTSDKTIPASYLPAIQLATLFISLALCTCRCVNIDSGSTIAENDHPIHAHTLACTAKE